MKLPILLKFVPVLRRLRERPHVLSFTRLTGLTPLPEPSNALHS